jgi:hypothetical protein
MAKRYCKVFDVTAPPLMVFQSPPEDDIIIEGETDNDILAQQEEYATQIFANGTTDTVISGDFSIASDASKPTWTSFGIDVKSILDLYGTDRIVDFSFTRQASPWAENAYIKNVALTVVTNTGVVDVPFMFSSAREVNECSIFIHPVSSSGQVVHTYEYVPNIPVIVSATLTFELADDWYCATCCGDAENGVAIDVVVGVENLP